jgi:hypothetical protein
MTQSFIYTITLLTLAQLLLADHGTVAVKSGKVDYNRDVRPILSEHCFKCHGMDPKTREADLRLDVRDEAINAKAVVPKDIHQSELWARLHSTDPDEVMPPPETKRSLSEQQKEVLRRWIEEGATYAEHWAFLPPERSAAPLKAGMQVTAALDAFVQAKQEERQLSHAPQASKEEWLRRVSFDLIGLPPTLEAMDDFLADASPQAYERVVSKLLASPSFGENLAVDWLDVARYADTYGRHEDGDCTTWPYRDWVIQAINQNLPYDQFITWQTAGDMLPNATEEQVIATCFNRLAQQSNEAGSDAEEFRIEQVADRVKTNGLAFLGLSIECARCHDHKFDPISQRDFYSMAAMLNNIDELGLFGVYVGGSPTPTLQIYNEEQKKRRQEILARVDNLEQELQIARKAAAVRYEHWLQTNEPPFKNKRSGWEKIINFFSTEKLRAKPRKPLASYRFDSITDKRFFVNSAHKSKRAEMHSIVALEPGRKGQAFRMVGDNWIMLSDLPAVQRCDPFSFGIWIKPEQSFNRAVIVHRSRAGIDAAYRGVELLLDQDRPTFALVHFHPGNEIRIRTKKPVPINQWTHLSCTYDGSSKASGLRIYINGELAEVELLKDNLYRDIHYRSEWRDDTGKDDGLELVFNIGARTNDSSFSNGLIDELHFYNAELSAGEVQQMALNDSHMDPNDWFEWYVSVMDDECRTIQHRLHLARADENHLSGLAVDFMVMKEKEGTRRPTHLLHRGQFNQPVEELQPDLPANIFAMDAKLPRNRMGLAKWLTDEGNPLTARVVVNRLWQHFFGVGLVETSEDFGTQGQVPSHPELLDEMAVRFTQEGWDIKRLCREIVLSTTYRQAGQGKVETADPANRYLTHGPRKRLKAEQVRDAALATSGLLVNTIGGPSVKPYQPSGLWEDAGTQHTYVQDKGEKLFRKSLYTFWRRTLPPPTMTLFDAPSRENCKVRREQTGTPLQSLVLMNDPQFMEASKILAEQLVERHPSDSAARVRDAYRLLTSSNPEGEALKIMQSYLEEERQFLSTDQTAVESLLKENGISKVKEQLPALEVAATTLTVRMMWGLNDSLVKP